MALKTRNKVSAAFNMSSMTDIVFLLLIFFMITSTLISPNALDLVLPKSNSQSTETPTTSVSITRDKTFAVEKEIVDFNNLEQILKQKLAGKDKPTISLHADKDVPVEEVVKVMNIAKNNRFRVILATSSN